MAEQEQSGRWEGGRWVSVLEAPPLDERRASPAVRMRSLAMRRIGAKLVDWVLLYLGSSILGLLLVALPLLLIPCDPDTCAPFIFAPWAVIFIGLPFALFGVFEAKVGFTPGKLIFRLRSSLPIRIGQTRNLRFAARGALYSLFFCMLGLFMAGVLIDSEVASRFLHPWVPAIVGGGYQLLDLLALLFTPSHRSITQRIVGFEVVDKQEFAEARSAGEPSEAGSG